VLRRDEAQVSLADYSSAVSHRRLKSYLRLHSDGDMAAQDRLRWWRDRQDEMERKDLRSACGSLSRLMSDRRDADAERGGEGR